MKSKINCLPDLSKMKINSEYFLNSVEDEEINEMVENFLKTLGSVVKTDKAEPHCCLSCQNEKGENVLIYPGMDLPGVEIGCDVEGLQVGSSIHVTVNGKASSLTVREILVTRPCNESEIADKAGLEGVSSIQDLKNYLREREEGKKKEAHKRELVMEMISYCSENAEKEIDEEEIGAWTREQARLSYDENMSMGIDLRITEEGMISEEEVLQKLADEMRPQFIQTLVSRKYASEHDFVPDENALREMIRTQMAETGDMDDAAIESQVTIAVENEYFRFIYEAFMAKAEEILK